MSCQLCCHAAVLLWCILLLQVTSDVAVSKTVSTASATVGSTFTYTVAL
jgi:hypothetical protein